MAQIYFWLNAVVYIVLGLMCAINPDRLQRGVGYFTVDNSGNSEFLVIYAGLQLGLAAFYIAAARTPELTYGAILFSLCYYGGLVAFRLPSLMIYWPVRPVTIALAIAETLLLVGAIVLWFRRSPAALPA